MIKRLLIVLFALLCTTGCYGAVEDSPQSVSEIINENILITFAADRTVYSQSEIFSEDFDDYHVTIEYIGADERISIYHGDPLCGFGLYKSNGKALGSLYVNQVSIETELEKEVAYIERWEASLNSVKRGI